MSKYKNIVTLLHQAHDHIQYPRIHLKEPFVLQLAGANAKFPRSINITDGKPYGNSRWFGRIYTSGRLEMPNHMQPHGEDLQIELDLFQQDPAKYATLYGKKTGNCMFCHKTLTADQSVAVGYGPTCAENYGLPWGDINSEEAKRQSSLEFDLAEAGETLANASEARVMQGITNQLPPDTFDDSIECQQAIIVDLKRIALWQLSVRNYNDINRLLTRCESDFDTQYSILVTALWENL
jgi:hypothetical protein